VHNAEVDVNYSIYYPLLKPYASLYPKSKKSKASDSDDANEEDVDDKANRDVDGPKGDLDMWKSVEVAMAEGTLDALRNRKEDMPALVPKKEKKTKEQLQPQRAVKFKEKKVEEKLAAAKNLLATGLDRVRNDVCLNIYDMNDSRVTAKDEPYKKLASSEAISSIKFFTGQPDMLVAGVSRQYVRIYDLRGG
jgi:hypothetical protein